MICVNEKEVNVAKSNVMEYFSEVEYKFQEFFIFLLHMSY